MTDGRSPKTERPRNANNHHHKPAVEDPRDDLRVSTAIHRKHYRSFMDQRVAVSRRDAGHRR